MWRGQGRGLPNVGQDVQGLLLGIQLEPGLIGQRGWAGLEAGLGAVGLPKPPLARTPLPAIHPDQLSPLAHLQAGEPGCDFLVGVGRRSVCRLSSPPRPWMQEAGSGFDTVEADAHLLSSCCVPMCWELGT